MTVENLRAFDGMPKRSKKPKAIEIASVFAQCEEEERHVVETKKKRSYSKSSSYYRK